MTSISLKRPLRGLYVITDSDLIAPGRLSSCVLAAILGGARIIQYRDKSRGADKRLWEARELGELCRAREVPMIVNDDVELAAAAGAAGVHLGKDDASVATARMRLGKQALIGVSCYNRLDLALEAAAQGADYVAFGSFFSSPTKRDAVRADIELLRRARSSLSLPIVAIGGITPGNGDALLAAGADCLAVISGVFGHTDVKAAARAYARLFAL